MKTPTCLTHSEAQAFYDRLGARQDSQGYYEDPATEALTGFADFGQATAIFEFGCGTGRLAAELLANHLPAQARYAAVDVSATMVQLTRARLAPFGARAQVEQTDGRPAFSHPAHSVDRFLSTYVLDLLSAADITATVREAHRLLQPNGKLCLVSLAYGETGLARLVSHGWERLHAWQPTRVGGCRPLHLADQLPHTQWQIEQRALVTARYITSEVIVATAR